MTRVISVRRRIPDELRADPSFLYVGRQCAGWPKSIWGNPFKAGMDDEAAIRVMDSIPIADDLARGEPTWSEQDLADRIDPVAWYEIYVRTRRSLWSRLGELRGRTLGCWCGSWEPGGPRLDCHAVVLARLAENMAEVAR